MAQGASRLVGREKELGRLGDAVSAARDGARTVVVLEGDAGLGKSRLATEALQRFRTPKDAVGEAYGVELTGPEIPYRVATDLLRTLARDVGLDTMRDAAGPYTAALAALHPGFADDRAGPGGLEATPARVLPAFAATVEQLATDRLMWLLVEDLPWVDASSRDLVAYLLRTIQHAQLLILVTVRTHDPAVNSGVTDVAADWARLDGVTRLVLSPLEPSDVRDLVTTLAADVTTQDVDRVVRNAHGSPLLAEQLVTADPDADAAAATVEDPMLSRLRRLEADPLRLVQLASLGEGHLAHRLLHAAYDAPEGVFDAAADRAMEVGLLTYRPEEREFRFRHPLLRAAAEATLTPGDRLRAHRRWGRVLSSPEAHHHEPALLIATAHHWAATDDDTQAFTASLAAARETLRLGAATESADLLLRAWHLWDRVTDAAALAGCDRDDLLFDLMDMLMSADRLTEVLPVLEGEITGGRQAGTNDPMRTLCLRLFAEDIRSMLGEPEDAALFEEALAAAEGLLIQPASKLVAKAMNALGWEQRRVNPTLADRFFDRMLDVAREVGTSSDITFAAAQVARQRSDRGLHEEALRVCASVLGSCRTVGDFLFVEGARADALAWSGRLRAAVAQLDRTLARLPVPELSPADWTFEALCAVDWRTATGDWDGAATLLDRCERLAIEEWSVGIRVLTSASTFATLRGDIDSAERLAEEAQARIGPEERVWDLVLHPVRAARARAAAGRGNYGEALHLVEAELRLPGKDAGATQWPVAALAAEVAADWAGTRGTPPPALLELVARVTEELPRTGPHLHAWYLHARADLARVSGRDTAVQWLEVCQAWRGVGHVPQLGWASYRLADALVRGGDKNAARAALSEAWQVADRLGAEPLREAAVTLSQRARLPIDPGGRQAVDEGRPTAGRLAVLTERELEVLHHVASGLSNHEIAQTLFISPKTASVHVSHILTKLDASSRTQAAAIAIAEGLELLP